MMSPGFRVVVSGGYRTGSTFVYKAVLEMFNQIFDPDKFAEGVWTDKELSEFSGGSGVFKSHDFTPKPYFLMIHNTRNPLDILSSLKKLKPDLPDYMKEVKYIMKRDILFHNWAEKHPGVVKIIKYSDFYGQEFRTLGAIEIFLGATFSDVRALSDELSRGKVKSITDVAESGPPGSYAAHHISDDSEPGNYTRHLTEGEIEEIERFAISLNTGLND